MNIRYQLDKLLERPSFFLSKSIAACLASYRSSQALLQWLDEQEQELAPHLKARLDYYCKPASKAGADPITFDYSGRHFPIAKNSLQYFDIAPILKRFGDRHRFNVVYGDVTAAPQRPSFVKSRPIAGDNRNSVLLKMNTPRHFYFLRDTLNWANKLDKAIWRGHAHQAIRRRLIKQNRSNPRVDAAQTNQDYAGLPAKVAFMTLPQQLRYKFIISLEGNDVASNLKWAMHSNSVVISTKLKYETWFMEGTLVPNEHYLLVKDDLSDLNDVIERGLTNSALSRAVSENAHQHTQQFLHQKTERLLSFLVAKRYFHLYNAQQRS